MKYLKSTEQLANLLLNNPAILIIFVDPTEFMPSKLLLNYIYSHGANPHFDKLVFIWNKVDQNIYTKYQVTAFPQLMVLKGQECLFSSIGYNREQANQAFTVLCKEAGLGTLKKQLNKGLTHCPSGHLLGASDPSRESTYVGGCFECNKCQRICNFDKAGHSLHCSQCSYDICPVCSYSDVLIA